MKPYEAPTITIIEVLVEQGFASSSLGGDLGGSNNMSGGSNGQITW